MTNVAIEEKRKILTTAFRMPSVQTMMSRKSSITNAFVNSIIPVVEPTIEEIDQALRILETDPNDVRCVYCGDNATEWDHLRPLVLNRRPTGFISEIANLVPSCGKCNQSKGNKGWREWMIGAAKLSPTSRSVTNVNDRLSRLEAYERWREPTKVNFEEILSRSEWETYWSQCESVIATLAECQNTANQIRVKITETVVNSR